MKQPVCEAVHSLLSSAEVKNVWSCIFTSHISSCHGVWLSTGYDFVAWYFVKHRDNFTFYKSVVDKVITRHIA